MERRLSWREMYGGEVTRGELEKIIGGGLTKWNWADEDTEEEGGGKLVIKCL